MKNSNLCYTHLVNVYLDINVVCVHSPGVLSECTGCERVNMHVIALVDVIVVVYRETNFPFQGSFPFIFEIVFVLIHQGCAFRLWFVTKLQLTVMSCQFVLMIIILV